MKKGELNEKQEKFCQKYALSGNASDSAQSAGYASSSAKVQGFKLLQLPYINERIEELRSEMTTSYDVVKELEDQYFAQVRQITSHFLFRVSWIVVHSWPSLNKGHSSFV